MNSSVIINLKKDKMLIKLNDDFKQNEIIEELKKKLPELKKFYNEEKTPISVTGKILKSEEMDEIQNLIKESIDVDIDFDTPRTMGLHSIKKAFDKKISASETKFYRGSLRSGQKIESEGSLVIIGDVNSGAEVIASENIAIIGALRGLAHAGAKGNKQAIIAANMVDTVQIRIADIVKEIDRNIEPAHKRSYMSVIKDEIVIE